MAYICWEVSKWYTLFLVESLYFKILESPTDVNITLIEEKCSGGSSLSLSSLGLSMLAQSVVEALEWRFVQNACHIVHYLLSILNDRMQLDACLQDDRAKAKYMQDERQSRIQV